MELTGKKLGYVFKTDTTKQNYLQDKYNTLMNHYSG